MEEGENLFSPFFKWEKSGQPLFSFHINPYLVTKNSKGQLTRKIMTLGKRFHDIP